MTRYDDQDEPGVIAEQEAAEEESRRAEGIVRCSGPWCKNWLEPHQVVTRDRDNAYGPCCAVIGAVVDADLVEAVCLTALARGAVLGRRVSVGPYTPAVKVCGCGHADHMHLDGPCMGEGCDCRSPRIPDWCVIHKGGAVLATAHDLYEVVRWYCLMESGEMEWDPSMGTDARPTDATIAEWDREERATIEGWRH